MNAKRNTVTFARVSDEVQDVLLDGEAIGHLLRKEDWDNAKDVGLTTTVYVTPKIWAFEAECGPAGAPFEASEHRLEDGVPWKVVKREVRDWIAYNLAVCDARCQRTYGTTSERPAGGTRGYGRGQFVKQLASAECGQRP